MLGGGCFWGVEELFSAQKGVLDTEVGYAGGENERPTYENHPGHAEVLKIWFDPKQTNRLALLEYFFRIHDPTTLNRQGGDVGSSYRSVIFYSNEQQKREAELAIAAASKKWAKPIVTALEPLKNYFPAEEYHQDYLKKNPGGYTCHFERW